MFELRSLTPDDFEAAVQLWVTVFGTDEAYFRAVVAGSGDNDFCHGIWVDGELVSTVLVYDRPIRDREGRIRKVAGLANVATLESHRGKGYSGMLIESTHREMEANGFEWGYLGTGVNDHYARYGWRTVSLQIARGTLEPTAQAIEAEIAQPNDATLAQLEALYGAETATRPMAHVRSTKTWQHATRYFLEPVRARLTVDRTNGQITSYLVSNDSDQEWQIVEAIGSDEGLRRLGEAGAKAAVERGLTRVSIGAPDSRGLFDAVKSQCRNFHDAEGRWMMARPIGGRISWPDLAALHADPRGRHSSLDNF